MQDDITRPAQKQSSSTAYHSKNLTLYLTEDSRVLVLVPPSLEQCLVCHLMQGRIHLGTLNMLFSKMLHVQTISYFSRDVRRADFF